MCLWLRWKPVYVTPALMWSRFGEQYVATGRDGPAGLEVIADLVVIEVSGDWGGGVLNQRGRESERPSKGVLMRTGSWRWFAHVSHSELLVHVCLRYRLAESSCPAAFVTPRTPSSVH